MRRTIECLGSLGDVSDVTSIPNLPTDIPASVARDLAKRALEDTQGKVLRQIDAVGKKTVAAASSAAAGQVQSSFRSLLIGGGIVGALWFAHKKGWIG